MYNIGGERALQSGVYLFVFISYTIMQCDNNLSEIIENGEKPILAIYKLEYWIYFLTTTLLILRQFSVNPGLRKSLIYRRKAVK